MKHVCSLLASAAILFGGLLALPAEATASSSSTVAASAAGGGCVSQSEFRRIRNGWGKARVHRAFGTDGRRSAISHGGGHTFEIRSYRACTRYGAVSVGFHNGRVESKSAVF